jgi:regulator of replication initiation timing
MEYNELFEKYRKLLEENQKLKNENEDYRKRLGLPLPSPYIRNDVQASIEVNNSFERYLCRKKYSICS